MSTAPVVTPKPRRRFKFRRRTLLMAFLVISVPLAWVAHERWKIAERRKALMGASFDNVGTQPAWRIWLLGNDPAGYAGSINALGDEITDASLAHLEGLAQLRTLFLGARVTDAGLAHLEGLKQLNALNLDRTQVTDAGLEHLKGLTELEWLWLEKTRITDAGLAQLKGLTRLKLLDLTCDPVTDAGLLCLQRLTQLEKLTLSDTQVTDAGLAHLEGMTQLNMLCLDGTRVTDAGLEHLKGFTQLEVLWLNGTQVTDAGLEHLKGLTQLGVLLLGDTRVTGMGLARLKELTQLHYVDLDGAEVTDAGLAYLKALTELQRLSLNDTKVTDAGLVHLKALTKLQDVRLKNTQVMDVGVAELRKALPHCMIEDGSAGAFPGKGHLFAADRTLAYVNVYSTAPKADQGELALFVHGVSGQLLTIEGIGVARNLGDRISVMRLRLDPDRMLARKVSSEDVMRALAWSRMVERGDWLEEFKLHRFRSNEHEQILFDWRGSKLEQYEGIIVRATPEGEVVRLKDIGGIELVSTLFEISTDVDRRPAATIVLKRIRGSDAELIEAVKQKLQQIKTNGVFVGKSCPPGTKFEVIPFENESMIYVAIETPQDSTREFTKAKCHELGAIAKGVECIASVTELAGYQLRSESGGSSLGTCLIHLTDRSDRKLTSRQIIEQLEEKCRTINVRLDFFEPPAFSAFFAAGGFSVRLLDTTKANNDERPEKLSERFMDEVLNRDDLAGMFTFLASNYPQYELVIDNDVAKQKCVSIANAIVNLAEVAASDAQPEPKFLALVDELSHASVKNDRGEVAPYRFFLQLKNKLGLNDTEPLKHMYP